MENKLDTNDPAFNFLSKRIDRFPADVKHIVNEGDCTLSSGVKFAIATNAGFIKELATICIDQQRQIDELREALQQCQK